MRTLTQTLVLSRLGFAGLLQRKWSSLVLVGSVACVIGVLLSMLSVTSGQLRAYQAGEDPGLALVLSPDFHSEFGNGIAANTIGTILDAPGIATASDGHPLGDAEFLFTVPPTQAYYIGSPELRGIGAAGFALRPQLHVVEGRPFRPGRQELIVGVAAARAYQLHVGDLITLPGGAWPIVGSFADDGGILEGQFLADASTLLSAGKMAGFGSVLVRLKSPNAFEGFAHWLETNPALAVAAERQSEYSLRTVNRASAFFTTLTYIVGVMMALGALFGIVKLMYAAVSVRTREIATLRAIGYQPFPLAMSVLLETALLSLVGALLGAGAAWVLFNGKHVLQFHDAFDLSVSLRLFALGVAWALVLAIVGGLPPAMRSARLSVAEALRAI
jgi:putative ABC transport system permease protein